MKSDEEGKTEKLPLQVLIFGKPVRVGIMEVSPQRKILGVQLDDIGLLESRDLTIGSDGYTITLKENP